MKRKTMLELHDLMFAASPERLNWLPFTGTCLFADQPSDGIPSGGVDKPVRFPSAELDKALDSMVDMGVDCEWPEEFWDGPEEAFSGHDDRFKIGVVKTSVRKDNEMVISGGLWSNDFSDICDMYRNAKASLGFSVEVYFNLVDQGEYYDAVDIEFTGVAILFSDLAAFKDTYIAAKRGGDKEMTKEEMKELLELWDSQRIVRHVRKQRRKLRLNWRLLRKPQNLRNRRKPMKPLKLLLNSLLNSRKLRHSARALRLEHLLVASVQMRLTQLSTMQT